MLLSITTWIASTQNAQEGVSAGYFRLSRDDTAGSLSVNYTIDTGNTTAANGTDFPHLSGTSQEDTTHGSVTFAADQATVDITVDPTGDFDDSQAEGTEQVRISLTAGGGYSVSSPSAATVSVIDNDNSAPTVQNGSKTVLEDGVLALAGTDFTTHFSDADTGDSLQAVKITAVPQHGQLKLSGTTVTADQVITLANLGSLEYDPATNYSGSDSFQWKATDGKDYSVSAATMSITVTAVNDAPTVSDIAKSVDSDKVLTFSSGDFTATFNDVDTPYQGDSLQTVKITDLPVHGTLKLSTATVQLNDEIAVSSLGNLTYQVTAGYSGAADSFAWEGSDGTAYSPAAAVNVHVNYVAIVDDGDSGFSTSGTWSSHTAGGYQGDLRYAAAGSGSVATWTFDVAPGQYQAWATWTTLANRATNAPYTINDGNDVVGTVSVNQQAAPAGLTDYGVNWQLLGTFTIYEDTLNVELNNAANGFVIADAIRIKRVGDLATTADARVLLDGRAIDSGTGSVDFGILPVAKTFTVKNVGTQSMPLDTIAVPTGFEVSDFTPTTLAPGASTDFTISLSNTATGRPNGPVTLSGSSQSWFTFNVSGGLGIPRQGTAKLDAAVIRPQHRSARCNGPGGPQQAPTHGLPADPAGPGRPPAALAGEPAAG